MNAKFRAPRGIFLPHVITSILLVSSLVMTGCPGNQPESTPPVVEPSQDGGFPIVNHEEGDNEDPTLGKARYPDCVRACAKLKELTCPEAEQPKGGKTCYAVCRDAEASGKYTMKPACVALATTIDSVRACKTVRCLK